MVGEEKEIGGRLGEVARWSIAGAVWLTIKCKEKVAKARDNWTQVGRCQGGGRVRERRGQRREGGACSGAIHGD